MDVQLTSDQQAFIRDAIASGRLHNEADALREAMALWERRERARSEILAAVDAAEAQVARGKGRPITEESMRDLAQEISERGRARLSAAQKSRA